MEIREQYNPIEGVQDPLAMTNLRLASRAISSLWRGYASTTKALQAIIPPAILGGGQIYDIRSFSDLDHALSVIASNSATLYITQTTAVTANTTIPSNISIKVLKGGSFSISAAVLLSIYGPYSGFLGQHFTGSGSVAFSPSLTAIPEWWGAIPDSSTDCSAAIQAAIDCGANRVYLTGGASGYRCVSTISMADKDGMRFGGAAMDGAQIYYDPASPGGTLFRLQGSRFCTVEHLYLNGNSEADCIFDMPRYNAGLLDVYNQLGHTLDRVRISGTAAGGVGLAIGDTAVGGTQLDNLRVNKCFIANSGTLCTIKGNVTFHIAFHQTVFSAFDGIPTVNGVHITDNAGLVYFSQCQFVGSAQPNGFVRRSNTAGTVGFSDCEMENIGPMFVGDDDTGFANLNPVTMQNCVWGQVGGVGGTANFGITNGSPICTTGSTGNYVVGQRVTGTGIPSQTRILSIQDGVSITLTQNATATNAAASLTITNIIIDYYQHGAFTILGGKINCSNTGYIEFAGGGTRGVNTGLVHEIGTYFVNVSYVLSGAAQLCRVDQLGNVTFDTDRMTINGATGTTAIPGAISTGALVSSGSVTAGDSVTAKSATVATVVLERTANAASSDEVANAKSTSLNASGVSRDMSELVTRVDDATNTSEDSSYLMKLFRAGVKKTVAILQGTGILTVTGANQGRLIAGRENNAAATSEPGTWEAASPNASGNAKTWARIVAVVDDATDASEDASLYLRVASGGSEIAPLVVSSTGRNMALAGALNIAAIGGTLNVNTTQTGNVGAGEDDLISYTLPADVLSANGDSVTISAAGTFAANANNKRIRAYFGSDVLYDTTALAFNTGDWSLEITITRTGATSQKAVARWTCGNTTTTATPVDYTTPGRTLSGTNVIKLTGEATADNDIVQELLRVAFEPTP